MADQLRENEGLEVGGAQEGVSESAREAFREQAAQNQAAIKQIRTQEGKAKKYDQTVVNVIIQLLNSGKQHDHLVVLMSSLIEIGTPSDFLLALITLQFPEVKANLSLDLNNLTNYSAKYPITPNTPPEIIDWLNLIINCATKDGVEILEKLIQIDTWQIHPSLFRLANYVLNEYLKQKTTEVPQTETLIQNFFNTLFEDLQTKAN